ncbi:MAG TPA: AMP-binding protein, partial [Gemmatimonadaceae bacterium]|nr:AMP-binding protein [Gemmatimonadaceae bacterium]
MPNVAPDAAWAPGGVRTGHQDTFGRDALPPQELWPRLDFTGVPELRYPDRLNCAAELLDRAVERGAGDRVVIRFPGGSWTYRDLMHNANRIAHVLVEDLGVVPGNRVLLRGPNNPMMAACWFAVLKAGGVVVCTMPLLRTRELVFTADKARIALALTDTRLAADCEEAFAKHGDGSPRTGGRVVHYGAAQGGPNGPSLEELMQDKPTSFDNVDTAAD